MKIAVAQKTIVEVVGALTVWLDSGALVAELVAGVCSRLAKVFRVIEIAIDDAVSRDDTRGDLYRAIGQLRVEADQGLATPSVIRDACRLLSGVHAMLSARRVGELGA